METSKSLKLKKSVVVSAATAAVLTFLVYLPSLRNGFVKWDDYLYIYENASIRSLDLQFLKRAFISAHANNWHPLTMISYAVDYHIWGLNPLGYHLENILFHSINTFLVAALASRLYSAANSEADDYDAAFAGLIAALLFGLHPVHVESVSWASEMKDVLSGLFFILSIITYIKFALKNRKSSPLARNIRKYYCESAAHSPAFYYFLSLAFFILALMSKPMVITTPVVLLLLDFYPLGRLKFFKRVIFEKIPFFILSVISACLTIWAQGEAIVPLKKYPFDWRAAIAVTGYTFYLFKTILPIHLAPYYPIPPNPFGPVFFVSLTLFLVISAFCVLTMRKKKIFAATWLYYVITLTPVIGIIQAGTQAAADRYTYIPLLGVFIAAGGGLGYLIRRVKRKTFTVTVLAAILTISAALSILTIGQERVWRNDVTLWSQEVQEIPDSSIGFNNLGEGYLGIWNYAHAMDDFNTSIRLDPLYADPYNNRALIYLKKKQYALALEDFNTAVRLKPNSPTPRSNRGITLLALGRVEEAIEDLNTSIILDPQNGANYYYIGLAYSKLGDVNNASVYFQKAKKMGVKINDR